MYVAEEDQEPYVQLALSKQYADRAGIGFIQNHQAPFTLSMFLMLVMSACIYNILSGKQHHTMTTNIQLTLRLHLQQLQRERVRQQEMRVAETLGYGRPAKISTKN